MKIWTLAGVVPSGKWYRETHTFMLASLEQANDRGGYFMTDSSTWLAAQSVMENLRLLFRGDPLLVNTYHALMRKHTSKDAATFVEFITSPAGQVIVSNFGKDRYVEPIYRDAAWAREYADYWFFFS